MVTPVSKSFCRSHAICSVRVENTRFRAAEDGRLFLVDLAGSETAADAQFHDMVRFKYA